LTENDRTPPAGRGVASFDELAWWLHTRAALWTLLVLGALLALGGLWFVVFGHAPRTSRAEVGRGSQSSTSTASVVASQTAPLTPSDVDAVLARIDYTESDMSSQTVYVNAVRRVLAGVDVMAFAQSTLEATPAIWWVEPGDGGPRIVTGAEKDALVAEALASYRNRRDAVGDADALGDVLGMRLFPPTSANRNRLNSLVDVIGQGLAPLGAMFGAHDAGSQWAWHVEKVAVTAPDSADVIYSASVVLGASFRFANPSARYVKHLVFVRSDDGRWRLAGWSNYAEVDSQLRSNVTPPGTTLRLDEWWGAL
jgi:hypothetical protein